MKGVLPCLVRWTRRAGAIDFCSAFAALVSPVQNIIFLTSHYFILCVLIAQQPGHCGQTGVLVSLSLVKTNEDTLTDFGTVST
jgi:hypothetical protein